MTVDQGSRVSDVTQGLGTKVSLVSHVSLSLPVLSRSSSDAARDTDHVYDETGPPSMFRSSRSCLCLLRDTRRDQGNIAVKRQGVEGTGGVGCNHGRALIHELCLLAERGRDMDIFAATGTNALPGVKHGRDPFLLVVTELLPIVTLPRTFCAKNQRDLPGSSSIHRHLRSRITP